MNYFLSVLLMIGMAGAQQTHGTFPVPHATGDRPDPIWFDHPMWDRHPLEGFWQCPIGYVQDNGHGNVVGPSRNGEASGGSGDHSVKPTCRHPTKGDNISQNSWKGQSDQSDFGPPKKPVARKKAGTAAEFTESFGPDWNHVWGASQYKRITKAEPLDVPAIQETREGNVGIREINHTCEQDGMQTIPDLRKDILYCATKEKYWTCADKFRILEHDEATPPKYWCRKVQQ